MIFKYSLWLTLLHVLNWSFAQASNNAETELYQKILNEKYYEDKSKVWDVFQKITLDNLDTNKNVSLGLNFHRNVINYENNQGVIIDTTTLPIHWNIFSNDISLPSEISKKASLSLDYNIHFGVVVKKISVIPEQEEFDKESRRDWVSEVHKQLVKTIGDSEESIRNKTYNSLYNEPEIPIDDASLTDYELDSEPEKSWKDRVSDKVLERFYEFLFQLRFDFNTIHYKNTSDRFVHIFQIPLTAKLAEKIKPTETLTYSAYGLHTIGPQFLQNTSRYIIPKIGAYALRNGQFTITVIKSNPQNPKKVLLKFTHSVNTGTGISGGIQGSSYLVKKVTNKLGLSGSNVFKKAAKYQLLPITQTNRNQNQYSTQQDTIIYEFDLNHEKARLAYKYAARGLTHRTHKIMEELQSNNEFEPIKVRQTKKTKGPQVTTSNEFNFLGSTILYENTCSHISRNSKIDLNHKKFIDIETEQTCYRLSHYGILKLKTLKSTKQLLRIYGGILREVGAATRLDNMYLNFSYAIKTHNLNNKERNFILDILKSLGNTKYEKACQSEIQSPPQNASTEEKNWNKSDVMQHLENKENCLLQKALNLSTFILFHSKGKQLKKIFDVDDSKVLQTIQTAFASHFERSIEEQLKNEHYEWHGKNDEYYDYENSKVFDLSKTFRQKDKMREDILNKILGPQKDFENFLGGLSNTTKTVVEYLLGLPASEEDFWQPAVRSLYLSWKKLKTIINNPQYNIEDEKKATEVTGLIAEMFKYPLFNQRYMHFLAILVQQEGMEIRTLKYNP